MPCAPISQANINPPSIPSIPGIPSGFAPQLPPNNFTFPSKGITNVQGIFNALSFILPSGTVKPITTPNLTKTLTDGILSLLNQIAPFLMLYKFFMPILNLILCIIEVLCAIPNPFKLPRALRRLFRQCIPEFLALFPFFALIIMIISLLLLILTLIVYLIERIIEIIELIVDNINTLGKAVKRLDNDSILAITKKIGDLLCLLQNIFVIFGLLFLLFQVIKALSNLSFKLPPCDDSDNSNDGCCTTDVCPSFIRNNEVLVSSTGTFQYYNEVAIDSGLTFPVGFPQFTSVTRKESWQLFDPFAQQGTQFNNITHAFDLPAGVSKIFFPAGITYSASNDPSQVPYTVDLKLFYNPTSFGRTDPLGARYLVVNDCIVTSPPTDGVSTYNNSFIAPFNGTLNIVGGKTFEENGDIFLLNNVQPSITDLVHLNPEISTSSIPLLSTDGYAFGNVEYKFHINYEVLVQNSLITIGCMPEVAIDKNFINATVSIPLAVSGVKLAEIANSPPTSLGGNGLPDLDAAQNCILAAVNTFRQNISIDSANTFQNQILSCLGTLQSDTNAVLQSIVNIGIDPYKSTFSIDPTIQFTTRPIVVSVDLAESSGQSLINNFPADIASSIASNIKPIITFGTISNFTYDGYGTFNANITSSDPGNGTIEIMYNGVILSNLNNPTSIDQPASITTQTLSYTFVKSGYSTSGIPRRDDGDVARIDGDNS